MSDRQPLRTGCVIVDYNAGSHLAAALTSVLAAGIADVVVVDNATPGTATASLGALADRVRIVKTGRNIGYGAGMNRGVAALGGTDAVLVCNPDVVVHDGAVKQLQVALDEHAEWGIVGPTILNEAGAVYPSVRRFPTLPDAVGHAMLGRIWPKNPFTTRYREAGAAPDGTCDWVSGSCFLVRTELFERLGGFDEGYFMFAEDMDLCFRARAAGAVVGAVPDAVVTHVEGVSRRSAPYRMQLAHHTSALRFAVRTTRGPSRVLLPLAVVILSVRLAGVVVLTAVSREKRR